MQTLSPLLVALLTCLALASGRAADNPLKDDLAKLQGTWKATVTTDDGTSKWTLEIKGNKTKVLIESSGGDVVFKGKVDLTPFRG